LSIPAEKLTIEKMIYGGEGLGRVDGEVVLTPFVLPGESIEVGRLESRQHVQRAQVVRIEAPSPDRIEPLCPVFGRCGGCHYQHADYVAELAFKRDILVETLRRVGRIEFDPARIAVESAEPFGYRNRVQLLIDGGRLGYREMHLRRLVPIRECPIGSPKINDLIATLNRLARDPRWPRFPIQLEIFTDERRVQWNVIESERPLARHFFEWLEEEIPETVPGALDYPVVPDLFRVGGAAFFQVNRFLLPRLAALAIGDAQGASAWDLYAGVGLFSIPLARRFAHVTAVESGRAAIADLAENARRADVGVRTVEDQVEAFLAGAAEPPDFVLADPPRAGLGKQAAVKLAALRPGTLVIVACDPATLARDLAALLPAFEIRSLTLTDLFPRTFHIETIATLKRRD
jgi:23S rRNA (uracil1939-C5)-methyltransferase